MEKQTKHEKEKKLKHVQVYDTLYENIKNEVYPHGSQLPSETVLSEQMKVSRMTLRKALSLLQEDGLLKNVQGVGHFVCKKKEESAEISPEEAMTHPVYTYCTESIDSVEIAFRIEPPTKSILDTLKHYTPAVVIADRWYKHQNTPLAYSLSFLPIESIGNSQIDLTDSQQLLHFLESQCYTYMKACRRICSHSTAGNFTAKTYTLSEHDSFLLVQENIFDTENHILVSSKHYIPSEIFRIEINYQAI